MQFNTPYGLADDQSASYFCGLQEGLAIGAITGGVNGGVGNGQGYTLGKGGIYLTTYSISLTGKYSTKDEYYAHLSEYREFESEVQKIIDVFSMMGATSFLGDYICCDLGGGYSFKMGPIYKLNNGNIRLDNTWYLYMYVNGKVIGTFSTMCVTHQSEDAIRVRKYALNIAGKTIQTAYEFTRQEIMFYHLNGTPYTYFDGKIFKNGEDINGKVTSQTLSRIDSFNSYYLKLFCNPSFLTDFERQVTGCYPVLYDGVIDDSLIVSRFRGGVENYTWIVVREVTQNIGYLMSTHIVFDGQPAFVVVDEGKEYADFVDQYIAEKLGISINTEQ